MNPHEIAPASTSKYLMEFPQVAFPLAPNKLRSFVVARNTLSFRQHPYKTISSCMHSASSPSTLRLRRFHVGCRRSFLRHHLRVLPVGSMLPDCANVRCGCESRPSIRTGLPILRRSLDQVRKLTGSCWGVVHAGAATAMMMGLDGRTAGNYRDPDFTCRRGPRGLSESSGCPGIPRFRSDCR